MKIKICKKEILDKLQVLNKVALAKRGVSEISNHIFIKVTPGNMELMVYDGYEIFARTSICCEGELENQEYIFNTDMKLLVEIVKKIGPEIIIELKESTLNISSKGTLFELFRVDLTDSWKSMKKPQVTDGHSSCILEKEKFKEIVEILNASAENEKDRKVLNVFKVLISNNEVEFIATDGYRASICLAEINEGCLKGYSDMEFLISRDILPILLKALGKVENIGLTLYEESVEFVIGDICISAFVNKVNAYPDVKELMLSEGSYEVVIKKREIVDAIEGLLKLGMNIVKLELTEDGEAIGVIGYSDKELEQTVSAQISVPVVSSGITVGLFFRSKMLLGGIKTIQEDVLVLCVRSEREFITVKPTTRSNVVNIILPCRAI